MDEWADFTERNLSSAEKQRRNSVRVRAVADGVLQTTCNDINRQRSSADLAIEMRVNEMRDAKEKFEDHLNKVQHHVIILFGPELLSMASLTPERFGVSKQIFCEEVITPQTPSCFTTTLVLDHGMPQIRPLAVTLCTIKIFAYLQYTSRLKLDEHWTMNIARGLNQLFLTISLSE